jgi:ABC-type phosphate/phosphonate transport system substrate-binding protein
MRTDLSGSKWLPRLGWALVVLSFAAFVWGMQRRARLEASGGEIIRMLFVPSVEQGTLVERGDELAAFIRSDSGLTLRVDVPTSYAAVIQALGSGQADVAWMPAFAYVIANARYGAEAKLQVVRSAERHGLIVGRSGPGELAAIEQLGGQGVAFPSSLSSNMAETMSDVLDERAPGWVRIEADTSKDAVRMLLEQPDQVAAAISSWVFSGPYDFIGDGRKELEYERPGAIARTRELYRTDQPIIEHVTYYHGCVFSRVDSPVRRLQDLTGSRFAYSDETSTSGHIFPRMLLERNNVSLARSFYAGGHQNVVQAVLDGSVDAGAGFYSPPNELQRQDQVFVGDARYLIIKRKETVEERLGLLDEIRVLALSDPIPNDLCAKRQGLSDATWERFEASLQRYLATPEGQEVLFDVLTAVGAAPTSDAAFDGFREALNTAGLSAEGLLEEAERKLEQQRQEQEDS